MCVCVSVCLRARACMWIHSCVCGVWGWMHEVTRCIGSSEAGVKSRMQAAWCGCCEPNTHVPCSSSMFSEPLSCTSGPHFTSFHLFYFFVLELCCHIHAHARARAHTHRDKGSNTGVRISEVTACFLSCAVSRASTQSLIPEVRQKSS